MKKVISQFALQAPSLAALATPASIKTVHMFQQRLASIRQLLPISRRSFTTTATFTTESHHHHIGHSSSEPTKSTSTSSSRKPATPLAFSIRTLTTPDITSAAQLLAESFAEREPVTKHAGLSAAEFNPWVTQVLHHALPENISFGAFSPTDNRLMACVISETYTQDPPPAFETEKANAILHLLENLYVGFEDEYFQGDTLHMFLTATVRGCEGFNICSTLIQHTLDEARKSGKWKKAVGELTAPGTQQVLMRKIPGFRIVKEVAYKDTPAFKELEGSCYLVDYTF